MEIFDRVFVDKDRMRCIEHRVALCQVVVQSDCGDDRFEDRSQFINAAADAVHLLVRVARPRAVRIKIRQRYRCEEFTAADIHDDADARFGRIQINLLLQFLADDLLHPDVQAQRHRHLRGRNQVGVEIGLDPG